VVVVMCVCVCVCGGGGGGVSAVPLAPASFCASFSGFIPSLSSLQHIPGTTGVSISMASFFPVALATIPTFAGVKFVSTDLGDWFSLTQAYGADVRLSLMFAPEPKLAGVALGATSVVLAGEFNMQRAVCVA
jgi:dihydrodipicolinate synthase/N-acetylneuraminate lyase